MKKMNLKNNNMKESNNMKKYNLERKSPSLRKET